MKAVEIRRMYLEFFKEKVIIMNHQHHLCQSMTHHYCGLTQVLQHLNHISMVVSFLKIHVLQMHKNQFVQMILKT